MFDNDAKEQQTVSNLTVCLKTESHRPEKKREMREGRLERGDEREEMKEGSDSRRFGS